MNALNFDLPKDQSSIIKVIGIGGGGSNAVNHMYNSGIVGVNFVVCNTDAQALEMSPVPNKIQLGPERTQGLGAGSNPEVGKLASEESIDELRAILEKNTKMVFITAGMGGGTGTGGAPVIAELAKEMGILTVGIVSTPFSFEGRRKLNQAEEGIQLLKKHVDTILIISNDKIREIFGNLSRTEAFANADNILTTAAKSISEIITTAGDMNVDFADVHYTMNDSGVAIMGAAMAAGEDRAIRAVQTALNSPLLNDNDITGAKNILLNISSGSSEEVKIDEITEITEFIREQTGEDSDMIFGVCVDEELGDKISVTLIATGFENKTVSTEAVKQNKVVRPLEDDKPIIQTSEEPKFIPEDELTLKFEEPELNGITKSEIPQEEQQDEPRKLSFYTHQKQDSSKTNGDKLEDMEKELEQRKRKLKDLSYRWGGNANLNELENEPAYKRKEIELNKTAHSSDKHISRYTLDGSKEKPEIKERNSYLHDNAD